MALEHQIQQLRAEKCRLNSIASIIREYYEGSLTEKKALRKLKNQKFDFQNGDVLPLESEADIYRAHARDMAAPITALKSELTALLEQNKDRRTLRQEFVNDQNIISLFESVLTRTLQIGPPNLTKELIVVKTCYFKVLKDIILDGFMWDNEKYVYFTASAGQIRTKRSVFIREASFKKYSDKLMCGLSIERINAAGGINTNKYLAYLALCNSATDPWGEFDIAKSIVVDDMETCVRGQVDYIDDKTYSIERKTMDVPIVHTDGAGMVRLDRSRKNFMVRFPWIKGLLIAFPFDKFVREANRAEPHVNHGLVTDIYGMEHDILAEDIEVIFTKSQFKMWKYYKDWQEYCALFKSLGCEAAICNEEADYFDDAKINYQMLQSLRDLSDEELVILCKETNKRLKDISSSRDTMLQVFGATIGNPRRNAFQNCLMLYPELLQDEYTRDTLRTIKANLEKEACAGKLPLKSRYTFLAPDMYAFCQWLFLHDKSPSGLLQGEDVYCDLFESGAKLDCLRSPHLSMEHAVRKNVYATNPEYKRWFVTHGIYTSCHDLISKILQFDVDGDCCLVVSDPIIVSAAERNSAGIVPLYYEMVKASAHPITYEAIYDGMISAYISGNIGQISNDITKIWNTDADFNYDAIKLLCMENNFTIDQAKTLYKPTRPPHVDELIRSYTQSKVPHFFVYAKGKTERQVEKINESCVNRIRKIIKPTKLNFNTRSLGKFNYKMLMSTALVPNNEISDKIICAYRDQAAKMENKIPAYTDGDLVSTWPYQKLKDSLLEIHPDINYIVDVLVKHLFSKNSARRKTMFWRCFGDIVYENLQKNIRAGSVMCAVCGKRFIKSGHAQIMCSACSKKRRREYKTKKDREYRRRCGQ